MKNDKNHDTPRIYASVPIGSTVVVQYEDGRLWAHGTVENKGDHNHNGRPYTTQMTKADWLITRNSKHVKPTQITAEQYLQDQLNKHVVTDPPEDILKQLEKQMHTNHACLEQSTEKHTNNMLHKSMTTNRQDNSQTNKVVNNGQKVSDNIMPFHKNVEGNSGASDSHQNKIRKNSKKSR